MVKNEIPYEKRLIDFLQLDTFRHLPLKFIILAPSDCSSCQDGVYETIDSVDKLVLFRSQNTDFKYGNTPVITFDAQAFKKKGLYKTYSIYYVYDNNSLSSISLVK